MTLLVIADDELVARQVPDIRADILISCGDMPDDVIGRVVEKCAPRHILAVKGNHDSNAAFPANITDLHLRSFQIGGLTFGGFAGSWKYKPVGHHLFEQLEVESALASFPPVNIFIAHNSPRLIHDRDDDVHTGFIAFNQYIKRCAPSLFLHGHQHLHQESRIGVTRIIGTYGHRFLAVSD
jgi:Icc-related predicted phosphoesterase